MRGASVVAGVVGGVVTGAGVVGGDDVGGGGRGGRSVPALIVMTASPHLPSLSRARTRRV